ncbi:MAG: spore maturation protein CgeB [Lachnospiraceae bacterium]|nr:spore maturation protein CgeB [Lachnospiraceae bacterium]
MKIIFCRWKSICEDGITNAIKRMGHTLVALDRPFTSVDYDKEYLQVLVKLVQDNPDASCVLSVNFQPIVARACKVLKIPYLSWTVDCPSFQLYSQTVAYPTNRIFLLDRMQAEKFSPLNPENIFHLPLGCDLETWDSVKVTAEDHKMYDCDISFVGSLYSEKCKYNVIEKDLDDYTKGYVDALINAQLNVYGYNFLEDSISDEWAERFKAQAGWIPLAEDYIEDVKGIVADTFIGYKCTEQERIRTLDAISQHFNMDLWTLSDTSMLPRINNRGGADSVTMMPKIIKCSKINLNMTNRPIKTGLPLRIFDLMGAGGFVLSNYQSEIPEHFIPGEDIVLYDSIPDMLSKIDYYLSHEEERLAIAQSGYEKIKKFHTYDIKLQTMFQMAGLL